MKYVVEFELRAGSTVDVDELRAMLARWRGLSPTGIYWGLNDQEITVIVDVPDEDVLSEALHATLALAKEYPRVRPVTDLMLLPGGVPQGMSIPGVAFHSVKSPTGGRTISAGIYDLDVGVVTSHHAHEWIHQILALSGRGRVHARHHSWDLVAGDSVFIVAAEDHYYENIGDNTFRFMSCIASPDDLEVSYTANRRRRRRRHPSSPYLGVRSHGLHP